MKQELFQLDIIVNGKPVYEYAHEGDYFIEGRKGSTFEIVFYNFSNNKVLAVPSVDGLSVLDGNPAGPDSPGLVVQPGSSASIPGWMIDSTRASKFLFAERESSYARSVDSTTTNTGVIGLLVFDEKPKFVGVNPMAAPIVYPVQPWTPWTPWTTPKNPWGGPTWVNDTTSNPTYTVNTSSVTMGIADNILVGAVSSNASVESTQRRITKNTEENLGVGWGQAVEFKTNSTTFDKGEQCAQLVLYYDSRRNLERKGIIVERRESVSVRPNPFPGIGCKPPAGWKG